MAEIFDLKWRDVDIKRKYLYLYNTKNGEKREVAINKQTEAILIKTRKNPASEYVFPNREGGQRVSIRNSFCKAVKQAGLVDFRFHDLRHTFASHLAMSGIDLNTVRELLGHKSMAMTLRYSHSITES